MTRRNALVRNFPVTKKVGQTNISNIRVSLLKFYQIYYWYYTLHADNCSLAIYTDFLWKNGFYGCRVNHIILLFSPPNGYHH